MSDLYIKMNNCYILTVIKENDIFNIVFNDKPSVSQIVDMVLDESISEIDPLDLESIEKMIETEVSEVEVNLAWIEDFNTKLVFQKMWKIFNGNKTEKIITYEIDGNKHKCNYDHFIKENFINIKFHQCDEDELFDYVAYFKNKDNQDTKLYFNSAGFEWEIYEDFLKCSGFQYLNIEKASIDLVDNDKAEILETVFTYNK